MSTVATSRLKPVLRYPGAKWSLAPWIVRQLPPHDTYVEPFAGSCAVLFAKAPVAHELVNDLNGDLVTVFRVIRDRPEELMARIALTPYARAELESSYVIEPEADPVERARLFLVRVWMAHAGKLGSRAGWRLWRDGSNGRSDQMPHLWANLPKRIWEVVERLQGVHIECRPALDVIALYANTKAVLYVDPPYVRSTLGTDRMYRHDMTDEEHVALLEALDAHPGPVLLSGYPSSLYDDRLSHWTRRTTAGRAYRSAKRTEVLWLNPIAARQQSQQPLVLGELK